MEEAVCRPFVDFSEVLHAEQIQFYTDASGSDKLGFGAVFGKQWMHGKWGIPEFMSNNRPSIEFLELFAVAAGILQWAHQLQGCRVVMFCDNTSVVEMINKSTSGCKHCMNLVRLIMLESLKHQVRFFATYIRTDKNVLADSFSRLQF